MRESSASGAGKPPGRASGRAQGSTPSREPASRDGRRRRLGQMPPENRFAIAAGTVALIAGIAVLAAAGASTAGAIAGAMLLGLAGIAFVSLVFLIVGQSEEADRRRRPRG